MHVGGDHDEAGPGCEHGECPTLKFPGQLLSSKLPPPSVISSLLVHCCGWPVGSFRPRARQAEL